MIERIRDQPHERIDSSVVTGPRRLSVGLMLLVGCTVHGVGPAESDVAYHGRRPFIPAPHIEAWYHQTEACLHTVGDYEAVEWFLADSITTEHGSLWGYTEFPNSITMLDGAQTIRSLVLHEMVHHILQKGDEIHDPRGGVLCEFF